MVPTKRQPKVNSSSSSSNNTLSKDRVRNTRFVPPDYVIPEELKAWAASERPDLNVSVEIEKFRDYEFKRPYSAWDKVFKNWIRNASVQSVQRTFQSDIKAKAELSVGCSRVETQEPFTGRTPDEEAKFQELLKSTKLKSA